MPEHWWLGSLRKTSIERRCDKNVEIDPESAVASLPAHQMLLVQHLTSQSLMDGKASQRCCHPHVHLPFECSDSRDCHRDVWCRTRSPSVTRPDRRLPEFGLGCRGHCSLIFVFVAITVWRNVVHRTWTDTQRETDRSASRPDAPLVVRTPRFLHRAGYQRKA